MDAYPSTAILAMAARPAEVDFFEVYPRHEEIHGRLVNWSRYVSPGRGQSQASIWRLGKNNARAWHAPTFSDLVDTLDGARMEKAVAFLPEKHRDAIRWCYCRRWVLPHRMRRELGVTDEGLLSLIHEGRTMLVNRGA